MNRMRSVLILGTLVLLALSTSGLFGQTSPKQGYLEFEGQNQTRNIPAGSVNDPGSQLTYIVDTGINARKLSGDPALVDAEFDGTVLQVFPELLDQNGDGQLDQGSIFQNFISITNTHPTMAVTVHFRYFNDNCEDVLDFLVILTCNDVLMFDPFNFVIPGTNENTSFRFFSTVPGRVLSPMSTRLWGSGRFVIMAAASGASISNNDDADILFPFELRAAAPECNIRTAGELGGPLEDVLAGNVRNVGTTGGISANNLHVLNASQISFDYLVGLQTTAVPAQFITDAVADTRFLAYGLNAWARPSVDRTGVEDLSAITGWPDGDGPQVTVGKILLGNEQGWFLVGQGGGTAMTATNSYYLRNEVHGGDIRYDAANAFDVAGGHSRFGALGTAAFHIVEPENMVHHFLSAKDDYNGSSNTGSAFFDRSANYAVAATTYIAQIYDQSEDILAFDEDPPLNVSPVPPTPAVVNLKVTCICLRTWLTSSILPGTNVDDVTIQDMADIFGSEVLTGLGQFDGLLANAVGEDPGDLAGGWIRFVRDNTVTVELTLAEAAAVGLPIFGAAHGPGTSTFDLAAEAGFAPGHLPLGPSFLTVAQQIAKFEGFGAAWWLYAVASDPEISNLGAPAPLPGD